MVTGLSIVASMSVAVLKEVMKGVLNLQLLSRSLLDVAKLNGVVREIYLK